MTRRPVVLLIALGLGLSACGSGGGSASTSSFCSLIKSDAKKFAGSSDDSQAVSVFQKVERAAPSAIKSDLKTLVNFVKDASNKHSPSPDQLTKVQTASTNIQAYVKDKCKIDLNKS